MIRKLSSKEVKEFTVIFSRVSGVIVSLEECKRR